MLRLVNNNSEIKYNNDSKIKYNNTSKVYAISLTKYTKLLYSLVYWSEMNLASLHRRVAIGLGNEILYFSTETILPLLRYICCCV